MAKIKNNGYILELTATEMARVSDALDYICDNEICDFSDIYREEKQEWFDLRDQFYNMLKRD